MGKIFLCGHYEGIDERALELIVMDNLSIGDVKECLPYTVRTPYLTV